MKPQELSKEHIDIINNRPQQLIAKADLPLLIKPGLGRQISYSVYKGVLKRGLASIENLEAYVTGATKNEIKKVQERIRIKGLEITSEVPQKEEPRKEGKTKPQRASELKELEDKSIPTQQIAKDVPEQSK